MQNAGHPPDEPAIHDALSEILRQRESGEWEREQRVKERVALGQPRPPHSDAPRITTDKPPPSNRAQHSQQMLLQSLARPVSPARLSPAPPPKPGVPTPRQPSRSRKKRNVLSPSSPVDRAVIPMQHPHLDAIVSVKQELVGIFQQQGYRIIPSR